MINFLFILLTSFAMFCVTANVLYTICAMYKKAEYEAADDDELAIMFNKYADAWKQYNKNRDEYLKSLNLEFATKAITWAGRSAYPAIALMVISPIYLIVSLFMLIF